LAWHQCRINLALTEILTMGFVVSVIGLGKLSNSGRIFDSSEALKHSSLSKTNHAWSLTPVLAEEWRLIYIWTVSSGTGVILMARLHLVLVIASLYQALQLVAQRIDPGFADQIHPPLTWSQCTSFGSCVPVNGSVTQSGGMSWFHWPWGDECWENHVWNSTICPDVQTCYDECSLRKANYSGESLCNV
jgi:hypothetical protein